MLKIISLFRFSSSLEINSYLANNLKKHEFVPLKSCQAKAFKLFNESECLSVNEIDGSGKTLAYVLPIVNHLLSTKRTPNAKRGAIILTLHKQLALSIYKLIRNLDADRHLSVIRCGAITHYSPAIEQMCKKKEQQDEDLINQMINNNVSKAVNWKTTDILITTPSMLYRILSDKVETQEKVSPEFVVVDQADIILNKKESFVTYFTKCNLMLSKLAEKQGNLRYILSSSSTGQISQQMRTFFFEGKKFAQTDFCSKNSIISKLVFSQIVFKQAQSSEHMRKKLLSLVKLMKERKDKRVIIFCDSKSISAVKDTMVKMDIKTEEYRSKLSSQKRMAVLYDYQNGPIKVLLTTDLCNRGITFKTPIDCIISFDMCSRADQEISRMCRSNKQGGQYIVFNHRQGFQKEFAKLKENKWYKKYLENVEFKSIQTQKQANAQ